MPIVGENVPHDSARGHVSGESVYVDDIPRARNELVVDFYWSPHAHARILSLDLELARSLPGVAGLYTFKDVGGHNRFGPIVEDEIFLAEDVAEFIGHPIVIIAAENRQALKEAKSAVRAEFEVLEPVLTIERGRELGWFLGGPRRIARGDLEAGFSLAHHVIEGRFVSEGQDHFYLESQAAIAYPGEDGSLTIHSSTQNPSEVQEVVASVLGLRHNQVVCMTKRMGGGFGGKECQATHPAVMVALVAHKTKRPARIAYSKDDDMRVTGGRHPFQNDYRVGFTNDGLITALKVDLYSDGGAYSDLSPAVMARAMTHADSAYFIPAVEITGQVVKTNNPPNTAFRGFGGPQGAVNMENIIEEIACHLGMDALEIRKRNLYGIGQRDTTPYGQVVANNTLPELSAQLERSSDYQSRLLSVREFNARSRTHLKGIAMTPVKFGIAFNTKFLNQANALVLVYKDGTVQVSTGATEMGQGVNTKIRQLVADELGIELSAVTVMVTSTEKNNNTSATAASSASDLNGGAAVDACRKIRERLALCAADHLAARHGGKPCAPQAIVFQNSQVFHPAHLDDRLSFRELVGIAYRERVNLGERGFFATPGLHFDWNTGQGSPFLYYTMGWAVSEVLVDRFTGELTVERADILMDIGKPINPGIDRGQIVGAFVQGMGWVTTEKLVYSETGELLSHSPTTYKIPNIQDLPAVFNCHYWENDLNKVNLRGSKAVGEPPFLLAISVWCAVKHALSFVCSGELPRLKLPATGEEILTRIAHYEALAPGAVGGGKSGILVS